MLRGGSEVPQEHVRDGQIVLNISPIAVSDLHLGNESLNFEGRFGGIPKIVSVPMSGVRDLRQRKWSGYDF